MHEKVKRKKFEIQTTNNRPRNETFCNLETPISYGAQKNFKFHISLGRNTYVKMKTRKVKHVNLVKKMMFIWFTMVNHNRP